MGRSLKVSSTAEIELQLSVSGVFVLGYPATGPTYACGGNPAEPDGFEDVEITDVSVLDRIANPKLDERGSHPRVWRARSIMDGVDRNSPDVQRLLANLMGLAQRDVEYALDGALPEEGDA